MKQQTLDQMVSLAGVSEGGRQRRRKKRSRLAPFHGQAACEGIIKKNGANCANKAYYEQQGKYYCGVHSSTKRQRTKLTVDPQKIEKRRLELARWKVDVEEVAMVNRANGKKGHVRVGKLRMMRAPPHMAGYLKVFPNFRHGNRIDGFGCKTLSPKDLGPVIHGMLDWPDALNLENYHQGAKIFLNEVIINTETHTTEEKRQADSPLDLQYTIRSDAIELRKKMYKDPIPYRHKFKYPAMKNVVADKKNLNKPLFSIYYHQYVEGKERRFTYLQCRYFYCHWYEFLTVNNAELEALLDKIKLGYNLHILGYDGREVKRSSATAESLSDCLYRYYLDESKPYGHELVLYTLLVLLDPKDYPWNRFYRNHPGLYDGFID